MSPKIIESKFIIRGEDDASPQLNKISTGLEKLKGKLSDLHNIKIIDESQFDKLNRTLGFTEKNAKKLEDQFKKLHSTLNQLDLQQRRQQSQPGVRATAVNRNSRTGGAGGGGGGGGAAAVAAAGGRNWNYTYVPFNGYSNPSGQQRTARTTPYSSPTGKYTPPTTPSANAIIKVLVTNWPTALGGRGGASGSTGGTATTTTLATQPSPQQQAHQQAQQQVQQTKQQQQQQQKQDTTNPYHQVRGLALRAPGTLASATVGAMGGNALSTFGATSMSAGAGVASAPYGLGLIPAYYLMKKGLQLLVAHAATQPAIQYAQQGMGVANRIGEKALNTQAGYAANFGYMPGQTAQMMGQLGQVNAWNAMKPMAQMRGLGFESEEMIPYFQAITKAGGAGGRSEGEYDKLARRIGGAVKEKTQIPEFMSQLIALTSSQEQYLADISDNDNKTLLAITKWGTESDTAALRGDRGARNIGMAQSWMAREGNPAQEMIKYQMMGGAQKFGGGIEGYWKYKEAKEHPEAAMDIIGKWAGQGTRGKMLLSSQFGWSTDTTNKIVAAYNTGDYQKARGLVEKEGKALPGGLDKATGSIGAIAKALGEADWARIGKGLGEAANVIMAEQKLMNTLTEAVLGPEGWGKKVDKFAIAVDKFSDMTGLTGDSKDKDKKSLLDYIPVIRAYHELTKKDKTDGPKKR